MHNTRPITNVVAWLTYSIILHYFVTLIGHAYIYFITSRHLVVRRGNLVVNMLMGVGVKFSVKPCKKLL